MSNQTPHESAMKAASHEIIMHCSGRSIPNQFSIEAIIAKHFPPASLESELAEALRKSVLNCFRCDGEGKVRRLVNEVCPQCGEHRALLARYAKKGT